MSNSQPIPVQDKTAEPSGDGRDDLQSLLEAAEAAEKRYDHETAVAHYTAALELPGLTLEEQYDILDSRATTYRYWGNIPLFTEDANVLISIARQMGEKRRLAETLAVYGYHVGQLMPDDPHLKEFAQEAIPLAQELRDDRLLALSQTVAALGDNNSDHDAACMQGRKALATARDLYDNDLLFKILISHNSFKRPYTILRPLSNNKKIIKGVIHSPAGFYSILFLDDDSKISLESINRTTFEFAFKNTSVTCSLFETSALAS